MKTIIFLLLCSFISQLTIAQQYTIVPIELGSEYALDASSEILIGGVSKLVLPLQLPKGTVRWYYKFATSEKPRENKSLRLLTELAAVVTGQAAISSIGKLLTKPAGELPCNIYLLETKEDIKKFKSKLAISPFQYIATASREQLKSGTIEIDQPIYCKGTQYLAIQNPSALHKAHFAIEIAAVVSEEKLAKIQNQTALDKELEEKIIGSWKVGSTTIKYNENHTYTSNSPKKGKFTGKWYIKNRNIYYIRDKGILPKALYVSYITNKIMGYIPPKGDIAKPMRAIKQ
ncbi:MAG: hypothetical protein GY810_18240 [Aureispira sp.]|nr:hypothetical protein [Aureispira sp.]